jgi:CHAT domain-containing protein
MARALSVWAAQGGGDAPADHPDSLAAEEFFWSQVAQQSAASDALARSAARTAAASLGVGADAQAYEDALTEQDALDAAFARAAGSPDAAPKLEGLEASRRRVGERIMKLAAAIRANAPAYWDYRSPEPVSAAALQSRTGPDAGLLRENEALILWLTPTEPGRGIVIAVTKEGLATGRAKLTGSELASRVNDLRSEIDPLGYGVKAGGPGRLDAHGNPAPAFDIRASYELYQALLGDPALQALIKDKPEWLVVPSGPLMSLPPGVLVTAPPPAGASPSDASAEKSAAWLVRDKAISVLPSVSTLRTLRQLLKATSGAASDPYLAFADPDFSGRGTPQAPSTPSVSDGGGSVEHRGFEAFYRDGQPATAVLIRLAPLPGTLREAQAVRAVIGADPSSILTGPVASKFQLFARSADGRLGRVEVLEFATHGLIAGTLSDAAEPGLALAFDRTPDSILLRASEVSTLKLNADWVLLSACNTASPDAPEAQGLSGLARAFFFAGGHALLVSHWRVNDAIGAQLVPSIFQIEKANPNLDKAQALQQASLAILDDRVPAHGFPFFWAPYELIGIPDR